MTPDKTTGRGAAGRKGGAALAVAGVAVVAAALVSLVIGVTGGDDDAAAPRAAAPTALRTVSAPRLGVELRMPGTWRRLAGGKALRVQSADRRLGISVSTIAPRPDAAGLADDVRRSVVGSLRQARVLERRRARVAGRPAVLLAIAGANVRGERLQVLAMSAESRWRTYAVVAFGSPRASQAVLRQARTVMASLTFARPGL